ncbi:SOS response-associated peptidase family protein [Brachybacterium sp. UNK5269]|uniref:SOS response-associated peptidase family protein n=1 Tax=Brachybacterium sp. UNK5269 TaxID=3408576 RepID=UPI003BAEA77B
MLHAAGLTAARKAEDGESRDVTFTIVTREAREARDAGGKVHDRMPVCLTMGRNDWSRGPSRPSRRIRSQSSSARSPLR